MPEPPQSIRGRSAIFAVAAGAAVTAGSVSTSFSGITSNDSYPSDIAATAAPQAAPFVNAAASVRLEPSEGPQLVNLASSAKLADFDGLLSKGRQFAADREAHEAALRRPLFARPTAGQYTSGYGMRWGALHGGVDLAAPIGTPIYAAADGVVIESGPAAGYGMWVQVKHTDGTVTMYGHINTTLVTVGQKVLAGDQIATVGNRGYSTGPHLHFEVWLNGSEKVDPQPWLASRGIGLGNYVG